MSPTAVAVNVLQQHMKAYGESYKTLKEQVDKLNSIIDHNTIYHADQLTALRKLIVDRKEPAKEPETRKEQHERLFDAYCKIYLNKTDGGGYVSDSDRVIDVEIFDSLTKFINMVCDHNDQVKTIRSKVVFDAACRKLAYY